MKYLIIALALLFSVWDTEASQHGYSSGTYPTKHIEMVFMVDGIPLRCVHMKTRGQTLSCDWVGYHIKKAKKLSKLKD